MPAWAVVHTLALALNRPRTPEQGGGGLKRRWPGMYASQPSVCVGGRVALWARSAEGGTQRTRASRGRG